MCVCVNAYLLAHERGTTRIDGAIERGVALVARHQTVAGGAVVEIHTGNVTHARRIGHVGAVAARVKHAEGSRGVLLLDVASLAKEQGKKYMRKYMRNIRVNI